MSKPESTERQGVSATTVLGICYIILGIVRLALTIAMIRNEAKED